MQPVVFRPRARLLLQLGDQLIRNENIAVLELLKNSYDADAKWANVIISNPDDPENGFIIIKDNGIGMDLFTVKNIWMEPGSDHKEKLFKNKKTTPKFKRLPIGEKGIGRFGAHKLGYEVEMVTRKANNQEVYFKIDWNAFNRAKYLSDVPIRIRERNPKIFTRGRTGTMIIVKKLKKAWGRGTIRALSRAINSLQSPFSTEDSFSTRLRICGEKSDWLRGILNWNSIKDHALFHVTCAIEGNKISKFEYRFTPWETMVGLEGRIVTLKDDPVARMSRLVWGKGKKVESVDLSRYRIGRVEIEMYIFDREARVLELGISDKKGFKDYLDDNGGMRVYRDGIRVFDYGERDNDWLGLDTRRVNIPTKRISNNLIIGALHLKRQGSEDLVEKTNREGFVENGAYDELVKSVLYTISLIETLRRDDKERLREKFGPTPKSEPVQTILDDVKNSVRTQIKDAKLRESLLSDLERVQEEYEQIHEILLKSAGAGLSLGVAIHEIDKIVRELGKIVSKEKVSTRVANLVRRLSEMIDGYSELLRSTSRKNQNLALIVSQALFNVEFRLESHGVEILRAFEKRQNEFIVKCARNLIVGSILNILDNAIWWLDYAEVKEKRIFVDITSDIESYYSIIIADNGIGFSLPTEKVVKPFVSGKPDGMGLGLHIAYEIMLAHGGKLLFPDPNDFDIPEEFRNGAIVALCFKKEGALR